ncbi:MAG: hypothetical protein NVSMB17_00850 [Candidatus Dormibacteria bacterium]
MMGTNRGRPARLLAVAAGAVALRLASGSILAVAAGTPPLNPAPAGARAGYEASLGGPPRVLKLTGRLGHDWVGDPTYISNSSTYSRGELVYDNYVFKDSGADTIPGETEATGAAVSAGTLPGLCGPQALYHYGDYSYPSGSSYAGSVADLAELRIAADAGSYYVAFLLQNMVDPTKVVVGLGVNAGGGGPPGATGWKAFQHFLQVQAGGAVLDGHAVASNVDASQHLVEARIPRSALPGGTWQVAAGAGVWNGTGWAATVDLAFVEEPITAVYNCWSDKAQSQLIAAGTYPTRAVDTDRLRAGATDPAVIRTGPMLRLHYPSIAQGAGIVGQPKYGQQGSASVHWGQLQPYAAYVPPSYDPAKKTPLVMLLHCLTCNHNVFLISSWPGIKQLADARGAIVVTPLAYGEGGHYEEEAEYDVFDVLADVSARYNIDADRLYLSGFSMGSLGTYRLGLLYPDLWAETFSGGNYTVPFCVTPTATYAGCGGPWNYEDLIPNARNLRWGIINGGLDELTPVTQSREIASIFDGNAYPYRFWLFPNRAHDPSLMGQTADLTGPWIGSVTRLRHPARVTYVVEPVMFNPSWGLRYDRAYWLGDIRVAPGAASGRVDAVSGRGEDYTTSPVTGSGTSDAGQYLLQGLDRKLINRDVGNTLELKLRSVTSVAISTGAALLKTTEPIKLTVDSDTAATVFLDGCNGALKVAAGVSHAVVDPAACARGLPSVPLVGAAGLATGLPNTGSAATRALLAAMMAPAWSAAALLGGLNMATLGRRIRRRRSPR